MKVSVITPFYYGNEYMDAYQKMMNLNEESLLQHNRLHHLTDELEILLINDSPTDAISLSGINRGKRDWHIINNEKNLGIHASRVHGMKEATGDYLLFLDQDDSIATDAVVTLMNAARREAQEADTPDCYKVLIVNAYLEQQNDRQLWYRTNAHKELIWDFKTYLTIGTQIISPGQCLLYKKVIPEFWQTHLCYLNGSDDYFLWLLLLEQGVGAVFIDKPLYTHHYTSQNLSLDTTKTDDSNYEFIKYLRQCDSFAQKDVEALERMIHYKAAFRKAGYFGKIALSLQNLDILISNIIFKRKTKTPYGFNR